MASASDRLGPFRHRPFAVYWAGGFLSNLGTWLQAVAASVFVYQLTGSALAVGILNFAGFVPTLLFSVPGGVMSDRYDRRHVVIAGSAISLVAATLLAALTFAGAVNELVLIVSSFVLNTSWALAKPSMIAMLPALVPKAEVKDAVGLNTLQFILGQIAGPLLAALVMATAGATVAFTINALTFVAPIASMVYLLRHDLGARTVDATIRARGVVAAGARSFIRDQPWVIALLAGVVTTSAPLEIIRTLSPAIAVEGLGEPGSAAGIIVAAQSVGSAAALAVFVPFRRRGWSRQMVVAGLLLQATGLIGTALAPSLAMAVLAVSLVGFGFSLCFPILTGTLQAEVPDAVRGRVMSFHQMAHLGNRPATALVVGTLATLFGAQPAVLVGVLLAPVGLFVTRRARDRLGDAPAPPDIEATPRPAEAGAP